jgi:hypothetical protein
MPWGLATTKKNANALEITPVNFAWNARETGTRKTVTYTVTHT